jgi:predicted nucleic acid-binding protein
MIYLDTCLLIYAIENHPAFADRVRTALAGKPVDAFAISPLVEHECLVKPLRDGDLRLLHRYEDGLAELAMLEISEQVFIDAARLRARHGLKTPDALHLACALHHGCDSLWTNDDRLAQAAHGLAVNVLA